MLYKKVNEEASAKKIDKIKDQQEAAKKEKETLELKQIRSKIDREVDYTMDGSVKQLFLNLTKMQIPFDYEKTLEEFFPPGLKTDAHGNYYIKIGNTKSMFCAHLDTYCYEYKRVWHVMKEAGKIYTDGTTTLGGDDKAGAVIMIKMIEAGVPGLYYFFRGEEGVTSPTGTWGSKQALKSYKDNFKKYDRCIAFDRKGDDSIITQQMYSECCSSGFSHALIKDLGEQGLTYKEDDTGMWCDSGVFMETIPECTNISVGYVNEHTFRERQDIDHLEKLVEACIAIKWEQLPTKRDPSKVSYGVGRYHYDFDYNWDRKYNYGGYSSGYNTYKRKKTKTKYSGAREYVTMDEMFEHVKEILQDNGYDSLNGDDDFAETEEMYFQNYKTGDFFGLRIIDFEIFISEDDTLKNYEHVGDLDTFEKYVSLGNDDSISDLDAEANRHLDSISREFTKTSDLTKSEIDAEIEHLEGEEEFTINQQKAFKEFTKNNKKLIDVVLEDIRIKNTIEVTPQTWIKLDNAMTNSNLVVDYGDYGINADDYIEWVAHNWDWVTRTVAENNDDNKDKDNNKRPEVTTLSEKDGIYYDIVLNQFRDQIKQFLHQVVEKGHVETPEQYEKYKSVVDGWIKDKYSRELNHKNKDINHRTFIDWIKEHKRDLSEYYKD